MVPKLTSSFLIPFILALGACKTVDDEKNQPSAAVEAAEEVIATPPAPAHLKVAGGLVVPGSEEALVSRGPNARCPTLAEIDSMDKTIVELGEETVDLVKEDLISLRQTMTRADKEAVASCCNQLEQLAQDVEIMNEEKSSAVVGVQKIRTLTQKLCPSSLEP